jgi:hypothetical protein
VRFATLYVVLRVVDFLGRYYWDHGALHGIRTIHFARWFLVEQGRGRRLIFLSNYDGSWENYLGDFIDQAASGLTGIWSNTIGFPDAKWLILAGARRELKFKRWVRRCQIKTQVWYSAYPHLSVANVQNNSMIRRGLRASPGSKRAASGCDALVNGAAQTVAIADVQALILRGFGRLAASCYLTLRFDNAAGARAWLATSPKRSPSAAGAARSERPLPELAFTRRASSASCAGGHARDLPQRLPRRRGRHGAATHPSQPGARRRRRSAPERWRWGNSDHPIDAVLLLFAGCERHRAFTQLPPRPARQHGVVVLGAYPTCARRAARSTSDSETGVSQPAVRNANPETERPGVLEGGCDEPRRARRVPVRLPQTSTARSRIPVRPICSTSRATAASWLAQLEEHVQEFWRAIQENADDDRTARRASPRSSSAAGRAAPARAGARDRGRSLEDANDFHVCRRPVRLSHAFGSHIRRGNPRDWHVAPTTEKAIEVSNQAPIIRRGGLWSARRRLDGSRRHPAHASARRRFGNERGVHFVAS